ncbi:DUF2750 domain-containing protein [Empedobacter brevis]|uniref:DUF2750 domain-containing protein n=2 Tax=Empedobacter brevis TaxID=247 RepID=A0A511NKD5_9FLAO|nr:DUF2750 domain-containing protein [Empedobacter brevis]MDM1074165.1 DUF2750 domain-containing protein [Empedobacter brevis]QES94023.1 DUF2750 domain-containing protein [Empedobacter brevis]QHC85845.1 hypothetical protein AS589_14160 [Empedobacter brevis]GEM53186.1 hypothetical protein EB1_29760 [Empedobacter brevis NBRC 14943 = ATCC 43319]
MSQFIKEICQDQKVYLLTSEQGFAISYSEEFEYEDGSNLEVICFWSNTDLAEKAKRNQWANHTIDSIELNTFLEEWLFGMIEEVSLVGINFDETSKGEEQSPLDTILAIVHELNQSKSSLKLNHFENLEEIQKVTLELKQSFNQ